MAKRDHVAAPGPEYPGFCGTCARPIIRVAKPGMMDKRFRQGSGKYGRPFLLPEDFTWRHRPASSRYWVSIY